MSTPWSVGADAARDRSRIFEKLNQSIRRLLQTESESEWSRALVDSTEDYCRRAALFALAGQTLQLRAARNLDAPAAFSMPLSSARAFASAVETRDRVIALRSAREISPAFAFVTGQASDARFYLFPLTVRDRVTAVLYADSEAGEVESNALELLASFAALVLEGIRPGRAPATLRVLD